MHNYFLLQCTLKGHKNVAPHPLQMQAYFFPKIFYSEHSYSIHRLLIIREIFDRIFSKTGNYHSFEMLWSFILFLFYRSLCFIFSISQKKLFECNVCFFIAVYKHFLDAKKAVKKRISTVRSSPQETCGETEVADEGKQTWYIRKCVLSNMFLT